MKKRKFLKGKIMNLFKISFLILAANQFSCTPPKDQSETKRSLTNSTLGLVTNVVTSSEKLSSKVSLTDIQRIGSGTVSTETRRMINNILANPRVKNLGKTVQTGVDVKLKLFLSTNNLQKGTLSTNDMKVIAESIKENSSTYAKEISAILDDRSLDPLSIEELSSEFIQRTSGNIPEFSQYTQKIGGLEENKRIIALTVVQNVTLTAQIEFFYALLNHPTIKGNPDLAKRIKSKFNSQIEAQINSNVRTYNPTWVKEKNGLLDELFPNN